MRHVSSLLQQDCGPEKWSMCMAERFRWVSRVSDWNGEPKRWTEIALDRGTLRVDGGAPMALSGLRRVSFLRHANGEANHPFGRDTATLRLQSATLRLELQGSLAPDVAGDPFPAVLARILTACAGACPALTVTEVSHGRILSGLVALAVLVIFLMPMGRALFGGGDPGVLDILIVLFLLALVVVSAWNSIRRRPGIERLADLARLLDAMVADRRMRPDALPHRVTAMPVDTAQRRVAEQA